MLANQLKQGESGTITKISADKALRDRFTSFGIVQGEEITLKRYSLAKQTLEVEISASLVVLRTNEAEKIEIEREEKK